MSTISSEKIQFHILYMKVNTAEQEGLYDHLDTKDHLRLLLGIMGTNILDLTKLKHMFHKKYAYIAISRALNIDRDKLHKFHRMLLIVLSMAILLNSVIQLIINFVL